MYITEIKRQIDRNVKIIRSNKGDEYYGIYDKSEQNPILFSKFLEKQGIYAQYTMPGMPQQNIVVEKHNHTLMEMVRSMKSNSKVLNCLWEEALKTTLYILNRVLGKVIPFELETGTKSSLRHLYI